MATAIIMMAVSAGLAYMAGRWIQETYQDQITLGVLLGYLLFLLFMAGISMFGGALSGGGFGALFMLVVMWFPALVALNAVVADFTGRMTIGALFFSHTDKPVRNKLGRMRAFLWDEEVQKAVRACLDEFEQYPEDPDILLNGAILLEERGCYREAADMYRRVMEIFPADMEVWPVAAWHGAVIYADHLGEEEAAKELFNQLVARFPTSEVGMRAREWLQKGHVLKEPVGKDPFYRPRLVLSEPRDDEPETPRPPEAVFPDDFKIQDDIFDGLPPAP